jgi:hypothetical protein
MFLVPCFFSCILLRASDTRKHQDWKASRRQGTNLLTVSATFYDLPFEGICGIRMGDGDGDGQGRREQGARADSCHPYDCATCCANSGDVHVDVTGTRLIRRLSEAPFQAFLMYRVT